ncbi:MAG: SpvB/TcaC N-terminal domain-containing protein, partial [Litorilituus sp.]|nr:SpvB/TcaC N-terminal domain-containing protein [Litorilituus sp.]
MQKTILIAVLLILSLKPTANAFPFGVTPPPASVSSPSSSSSGTYNVVWSMSGNIEFMEVMSSAQQSRSLDGRSGDVCPGGCKEQYTFVLEQSKDNSAYAVIYEGIAKVKRLSASPGIYRYRVKAKSLKSPFLPYSTYTYSNYTTVEVPIPKSPENPVDFSNKVKADSLTVGFPSQKDLIGTTNVNFRVDESGGATFNVPLAISPGMAGVTPQLSFNYNSNNPMSGTVGKGWSLSGVSAITRCPRTPIQDAAINGIVDMAVEFDEDDRFCLNGQKLILMSGVYGGNNATYKTLKDDFSTITSHTGSVTGPAYFSVKTKSGETHTFGTGTANNYPVGNVNVIKAWYIKSIKDTYDNGIYFNYKTENAGEEFLLDYINYGSSVDANIGKVQINYENKYKPTFGYQNGYRYKSTKRIGSITSYYQSSLVYRHYDLNYQQSNFSGVGRLTSITECANSNSSCLPSATFLWRNQGKKYGSYYDYSVTQSSDDARNYTRIFDINGDGYSDMVYPNNGTWFITYGAKKPADMTTGSVGSQAEFAYDTSDDAKNYATVIDFNGDTKQDLLIPVKSGNQYKWYVIYHKPHQALVSDQCYPEDIYNDKRNSMSRQELCIPEDRLRSFNFDSEYLFTTPGKTITIMDVNGDALQDVVYSSHGKYNVKLNGKLNVPGDFNSAYGLIDNEQNLDLPPTPLNVSTFSQAQGGLDVNGDGRTDVVLYHYEKTCIASSDPDYCNRYDIDGNWKVYLSNGRKLEFSQTLFSSKNSLSHM